MGSPEAEIRALIEDRIAAMRAKDAARAIATLGEDVVAFELAPPLAVPAAAARDQQALAAWLAGFAEIDVEARDVVIEADEHVGFARAASFDRHTSRRAGSQPVDALDTLFPSRGRRVEDRPCAHFGAVPHGRQLPRGGGFAARIASAVQLPFSFDRAML